MSKSDRFHEFVLSKTQHISRTAQSLPIWLQWLVLIVSVFILITELAITH